MSTVNYADYLGDSFDPTSGEFDESKAKQQARDSKDTFNILLSGATGVGKSSLVNAFFGEEIVEAGVGKPITQHLEKVEVKDKGLVLWDTKGIEAKDYHETISQLDSELEKSFKNVEHIKDVPHLAWLCIDSSGARIEPRDIELLNLLSKHNVPVVIVFTKDMGEDSDKFIEFATMEVNKTHSSAITPRFARVNSVERRFSAQFLLPVSGLENLLDMSLKSMGLGKKNAAEALKKAQRIRNKVRLDAMISGAKTKVHIASAASATAGASPIPGSDAPIIAAIQSKLIYEINCEFELDLETSTATTLITSILGVTAIAQIGKTIVSNVIKFIPGAGSFVGGAISATTALAITEAIGHAYIMVLENYFDEITGDIVLPDNTAEILNMFKTFFQKP
ncbi:YcjF family protein [Aliivibrio fischeri]|uniref:YcjF family protein n=1 Tax=Aliivibrio fischeri TaxID=668 RepID=UPI0012DAD7ED|nr:GTPase [Aliivibrio fischeri]MUJ38265.1 hypothetical protein [Aliivibrio fischeri]